MRTTVTLDPDTAALIQARMRDRGLSFKEALNQAIRDGVASAAREPVRTRAVDLGPSTVNLDRALQLAGDLEDEELLRRARLGK